MKMKTILMIALTATLGTSALWVATDRAVAGDSASASRKILHYTCPMHPSVKSDKPGACPICGMNLVPVYGNIGGTNNPPAAVNTNKPAAALPSCCSPDGGCCR
jgi:Cu(I)/Ag(I) efflux system membrane fusion protein